MIYLDNISLGNVDFSVLKKMRDLLPYLTDSLMVGATDIQNFFRFAYSSPLTKGICIPHANRQNFRNLIVKVGYFNLLSSD